MKRKDNIQNSIISNNVGLVDLEQAKVNKKRNPFFIIFPIIIFILFSGICFGGYFYYKNYIVESNQSIFFNYAKKIDFNTYLEDVLYSQIAQKNNTTVHKTNATLLIKSKLNQEEQEKATNKLEYNFDIFSNPQNNERDIKLEVNYSDNNLFKMEGIEKDKYMAVSCPDILDDYIAWEKDNTAYFMSKISNARNKFDYNKIYELFDYQRTDFDNQYKNELFSKLLKIVSNNTTKKNYEQPRNVTYTDTEEGKDVDAIGYVLDLSQTEYNKVLLEILKAIKEDSKLVDAITQDGDATNNDIDSSNFIYKIIESIILEKRMNISSSKLENLLDSKMIALENDNINNDNNTKIAIYVVDDKIKIISLDNNKYYIKIKILNDNSLQITYLAEKKPNYTDGTIKEINDNIGDGLAFLDKALEGEYIAPAEVENEAENHDLQPGNLKSIKVLGDNQTQENEESETQPQAQSTNSTQNGDNSTNTSEQNTNNQSSNNQNANTPNANSQNSSNQNADTQRPNTDSPVTTSISTGDGGTITIGEQGDVTYRNAPQELVLAVNESPLSREDAIGDSNMSEVVFSSDDESEDDGLREELHDIDNTIEDGENLTDTSLYSSVEGERNSNDARTEGFSIIIKKSGLESNSNNHLEIEYDEINNYQVASKYIIQMNLEGTPESKEIKNEIAINYYDNSSQKLINLKYTTKYGENDIEVPDIENNSVILDELEDKDFEDTIAQIRGFILKYIKLKKNQWDIITSRNG